MHVLGIDLSGPANAADTCVIVFRTEGEQLRFLRAIHGADDRTIVAAITAIGENERVVAGIDAPLSYNQGGGYRPSDAELSRLARTKGRTGVMSPTLNRMVYLTVRGIALTRALETLKPRIDLRIAEVHPGASMLLRGADAGDVAGFKSEAAARLRLLGWLTAMGMRGLPLQEDASDHFVAACAAALAGWQWSIGKPAWCYPAQPPEHPYDFAC